MNYDAFIVPPGSKISLKKNYDPAYKTDFDQKADAANRLQTDIERLANYQNILYAQNTYALLIIFQAMDAAGKDSTIKHVTSGVNPQGFQVFSFKGPSTEELDHDYLWRTMKALPERGRIGIFNRSYYEEALVVRVHPEMLKKQQLPHFPNGNKIWKQRFEEINNFEKYLVDNGVIILKFFLNVSKLEQKKRFLERIESPEKNWKFSDSDVKERAFWDDYMNAYEEVFNNTSTKSAPWYIIPADRKWFTRLVVANIICTKLEELNLQYPTVSDEHRQQLLEAKRILDQEDEQMIITDKGKKK
ncbi:MAG: polyphosphate kinase 2 family protein [Nostoc sp. NMS1]|uniref:polyphosphate kinase 2 family protein n=1 Tax=unclassified Nostoc TaxID=2593658 RepID=UPI0025FF5632|nr:MULTISPECIES: polyphosphate kinase 2 family protein [unclassified Nostoc]MBN3909220.1 polyphosphate kinase 2 family protein [Nostoc sp. NMS1]MBN3990334.1 polyphosphate kinase 2 family protein [Nostoc sp. NMS2]